MEPVPPLPHRRRRHNFHRHRQLRIPRDRNTPNSRHSYAANGANVNVNVFKLNASPFAHGFAVVNGNDIKYVPPDGAVHNATSVNVSVVPPFVHGPSGTVNAN
jgi:hypothetical protein